MEFKIGQEIWIPCEVKPGAFSNERLTLVPSDYEEDWVGFVPINSLYYKGNSQDGKDFIHVPIIFVGSHNVKISLNNFAVLSGNRVYDVPKDTLRI